MNKSRFVVVTVRQTDWNANSSDNNKSNEHNNGFKKNELTKEAQRKMSVHYVNHTCDSIFSACTTRDRIRNFTVASHAILFSPEFFVFSSPP